MSELELLKPIETNNENEETKIEQKDYEEELFEMMNQNSELEWLTEEYDEEQVFEKFTQRKESKKEKTSPQKKKLKQNTQNHLKEVLR